MLQLCMKIIDYLVKCILTSATDFCTFAFFSPSLTGAAAGALSQPSRVITAPFTLFAIKMYHSLSSGVIASCVKASKKLFTDTRARFCCRSATALCSPFLIAASITFDSGFGFSPAAPPSTSPAPSALVTAAM